MSKAKKKVNRETVTLYDVFRLIAAKGFNYPTVKMVSDGDIIVCLKKVELYNKVIKKSIRKSET